MCAPSPPTPPDPKETAGAQTAQNIGTAITQQQLNNVNQVTPDGSLTYDQTGSYDYTDPNTGDVHKVPTFTATQTLSDIGQATKDQNDQAGLNLSTLARDQSAALSNHLSKPADFSNENAERFINDRYSDDFNQDWDRNLEKLNSQLSGSGVKLGSEAHTRALDDYHNSRSGAYDNHIGNMYGQARQDIAAERNQPINEITALMSGSQVSNPSFVNSNSAQLANTDVAGLINSNYNQRLGVWQQNQNDKQQALGGLFGLGAKAITGGLF